MSLLSVWWRVRNKCNAGEAKASHDAVMHQIPAFNAELERFGNKGKGHSVHKAVCKCQKPAEEILKINTDGSFDAAGSSGGWGLVVRDAQGSALGAAAGCLHNAQNVLHAEAEACLQAVLLAQRWGMSNIHVECDSQQLISAILGNSQDLALNGTLFREIRFQTSFNFASFRISYCPRACNKVADALATHGAKLACSPPDVWPGFAPDFVCVLVASDIAELTR